MSRSRETAVADRPDQVPPPRSGDTPADRSTPAAAPAGQVGAPPETTGTAAPAQTAPSDGTPSSRAGATATRAVGDEEESSPLRSALSVLATLGPPITVVTALMHYFGWSRADVQAAAMGLDVTLFGYSPQDYVIRSVSTLYVPLLVTGAVALGWLALHRRIAERVPEEPAPGRTSLRVAGWWVLATGLLAAAGAVAVAMADDERGPVFTPLVLAVGAAVAAYGAWIVRATSPAGRPVPPWQRALRALLTSAVITLALFWQMSNYAGVVARGHVDDLVDSVADMPRVWAYSPTPLGIQAPGVREAVMGDEPAAEDADARYRTSGLRLLTRSGGRLFLLHDGWTPETGTVVLLPDDGMIRWQFSN